MPFTQPTHTNHTFLGYRGVSNKHFSIESNKAIRYLPPPPEIEGASQLGAGVYLVSNVRTAIDYAKDSSWNYYCSRYKSVSVEDNVKRARFEQEAWKLHGRVHAVFVTNAKYNSDKHNFADFSHINIDRLGNFSWNNIQAAIKRNPKSTWALKTQLFTDIQTIVYPPHTNGLFVKDITKEAIDWHLMNP